MIHHLKCVALPLLARDIGDPLVSTLRVWDSPRFFPVAYRRGPRPVLLVVVNNADSATLTKARDIFYSFPRLARCFSGFRAVSADLTGDRDLYARNAPTAIGAFGNKAGPNFLFQRTMELAEEHGGFTLQLELDCLPVEAGWIDATEAVIAVNSHAWVIGSIYSGRRGLHQSIQTHLNGNAIYATGDMAFQNFLRETWMADLINKAPTNPNLAYDCWWSMQQSAANALSGNAAWLRVQAYDSFFRNYPLVVNLLVKSSGLQEYLSVFDRFAALGRRPVFFHGEAMVQIVNHVLAHPDHSIEETINYLAPSSAPVARAGFASIDPENLKEASVNAWQPQTVDLSHVRASVRTRADTAKHSRQLPSERGRMARSLLLAEAARLLRDQPAVSSPWAIETAMTLLSPQDPVIAHFLRVLNTSRFPHLLEIDDGEGKERAGYALDL